MHRLMTMGVLAAVLGGGYAVMNGLKPADVQRVVGAAGGVLQNTAGVQPGFGSPGFGQAPATTDRGAPNFVPAPAQPSSTVRIATFNIQIFGDKKASNPNVMGALAAIVQQFDLVAIQEIKSRNPNFIDNFLRDYVNASGAAYSRVIGPRLGRTSSQEQYAFLFNTAKIQVNPNWIYTVSDPDDLLHREPLVAMFATRHPTNPFTFILVNSHTDPDETDQELDALAQVLDVVRRYQPQPGPGEDDVILLGDLNTSVTITPTRRLTHADLRAVGRIPAIYPVIRNQPTSTVKKKLNDNILVHRGATTEFTGRAGVFDMEQVFGLTRKQALMISDHLPVWAEFSVVEGATPGRLASGGLQRQ